MPPPIIRPKRIIGKNSPATELEPLLSELKRRDPTIDEGNARALAAVWWQLLDLILTEVFSIGDQEAGPLHVEQRADAVFEIANLILWLAKGLVDQKAKAKALAEYRAPEQLAALESAEEKRKITNTARMVADKIWIPFIVKYRTKRPLLLLPGVPATPVRLIRPKKLSATKEMHYVPQSSTRQWVDKRSGQFFVYSLRPNGEVSVQRSTPKDWGRARSIYTLQREHWFGLVEGDASKPYEKLVSGIPLNEGDLRYWVAFLIVQMMRTPRFMRRMIEGIRGWVQRTKFSYPTSTAALGRAYDTIFSNNDLYARYYRLINGRAWTVAKAADGKAFLKGDNPVVISGRLPNSWQLIYPLTPVRCFVAGPATEDQPERLIPRRMELSAAETDFINVSICGYAENSVIGTPATRQPDVELLVQKHLGKALRSSEVELPFWGFDLRSALAD